MRARYSSSPGSGLRLGSASVLLVLGVFVATACAQTVRGKAALPQNDLDLANEIAVTNIGVDGPVSTARRQPDGSGSGSTPGLAEYLQSRGVKGSPVRAGGGLAVTVAPPPGWESGTPDGPAVQVRLQLPEGDGAGAIMVVTAFKLSEEAPVPEMMAAAKRGIADGQEPQETNDAPYHGHPSTAGIVAVTTEKNVRLVGIDRYIFVQQPSGTYIVHSNISCTMNSWPGLRDELLELDSAIEISR